MNYNNKTKNELIKELQKLQQEYDSLKSSYEKDITGLKMAEKKEALILSSIPLLIYCSETPDNYAATWISENVKNVTGFERHAFLEEIYFWSSRLHPDDHDRVLRAFNEIQENEIGAIEYRWQCANGEYHWFLDSFSSFKKTQEGKIEFIGVWLDITERKQEEEELALLAHTIRSISESVSVTDQENKILFVNDAFLKTYGYTLDELIGKSISIVRSTTTEPSVDDILRTTFQGGWQGELLNQKKDGTEFPISLSTSTVCNEKGQAIALVGIAMDITERKQAEEMMKASEEKYRMIFNEVPIGIAISTIEGKIIDVNKTQAEMIGCTVEELKRRSVNEYYVYQDKRMEMIELFNKTGKVRDFEMELLKKDGSIIVELLNLDQVKIEGKDYLFVAGRDITRQKQEEDALRQSEMKLKTLFETLPIGISILDAERNVAFINIALERILKISKNSLIRGDYKSRKYLRSDRTQMPEQEFASVRAIREQRAVYDVETGVVMEDGDVIWTNVNAIPVAFPDWKVVVITTDITERKVAEQRLRESEEQYRNLFETASDSIFIVDQKTGNFVDANSAATRLYGYSREEFLRITSRDVSAEPEKTEVAIHDGIVQVPFRLHRRKDGTIFPVEIKGSYFTQSGRIQHTAFIHNITEQKKIEEALHLEKENFRHSLDDSPLGVRIATIEGNTIYANKSLLDFYGYDTLEELQQTPLKNRYTPKSYIRAQERKRQRERGDFSATEYEVSIVRKNGEIRHLQVFRKEIIWTGIRQFQVICNDITDRKQAEERFFKLNECFLKFGADSLVNINLLVALCGELLGGTCSLYNRLKGDMLCSLGQWNTPPGYQSMDNSEGHLCNDVIKSTGKTTVVIRDLQNTPYARTDPNVRLYRLNTYIGKAVKFNKINIGSLCVVFQRDVIPSDNEIYMMEIIASAIGVEEARKQAEEEIIDSKKLLEDLHKHLEDIRESERATISREIHDQLGQSMTALLLDLKRLYKYVNTNPDAVTQLDSMIELISDTIKVVQRISSDLRPGILDELGLISAIEWYCDEFEKRTGIKCDLELENSDIDDSQVSLTFFRVLQETLTNVIRHSKASDVKVTLHQTLKGTTLVVKDNGIGISREEIDSNKSLGLISMRERVKQFNGKIDISSKNGKGTKLTFFIPS